MLQGVVYASGLEFRDQIFCFRVYASGLEFRDQDVCFRD